MEDAKNERRTKKEEERRGERGGRWMWEVDECADEKRETRGEGKRNKGDETIVREKEGKRATKRERKRTCVGERGRGRNGEVHLRSEREGRGKGGGETSSQETSHRAVSSCLARRDRHAHAVRSARITNDCGETTAGGARNSKGARDGRGENMTDDTECVNLRRHCVAGEGTIRDDGAGDPKSQEILLESRIAIDAEQSLLKSSLLLRHGFLRPETSRACEIIPGIGTLQHRSEVDVDLETRIHLSSTFRKSFAQRNPDSVSVRRRRSAHASFELHENRVGFLRTDTRESFAALDRSTLQIQGSELKIGRRNSGGHACSLVPSRVPSRASGARVVDRQFYEWGPHVVRTLPRYAAYRFREAVRRAIGAALTLRKSSLSSSLSSSSSSSSSRSASDFENVKGRPSAVRRREQRAAAPAPATARLRGSYEPHAKRVRLPPRSAGSLGILGILGTAIENRGKTFVSLFLVPRYPSPMLRKSFRMLTEHVEIFTRSKIRLTRRSTLHIDPR
ncbi:hypothetical protein ALC53_06502 [Atta colombica]|uniref:Uncharacterized protein n=1 Tax=Atta colombica TaxID=520822 RepID=A0A195BG97_9HYME|nr:hypothetical protein ALC53_06502 [Atta colombica]